MKELYFKAMAAIEQLAVGETASNAHAHGTTPDHIEACNCAKVEKTGKPPSPVKFTRLFNLLDITSELLDQLVNSKKIGPKDLPFTPDKCSGCKAASATRHCYMLEGYRKKRHGLIEMAKEHSLWSGF